MTKKDPIAMVLDTGISATNSLSTGVRENMQLEDPLPGERNLQSAGRSISSAIEEMSPFTVIASAFNGEEPTLPFEPSGPEIQGLSNGFPPVPEGISLPRLPESTPDFVKNLVPDFLRPENDNTITASNVASNQDGRAPPRTTKTRTPPARDVSFFEMDPY